ncbi:MAG: 2-amino-4-hydroxy-6-hydroxymethyldihydropteridine diphosphokinase [Halieaceae bacterium]
MTLVYIGLGSNLDNPKEHVVRALTQLEQLAETRVEHISSLYRSSPVGPGEQSDYINAAARLDTLLPPEQLLQQLQSIEQDHQRERDIRWGPRTLDLDVLLYGDLVLDTERLTIPHPRIHQRNFVLEPLLEIDPVLALPCGRSIASLLASCPSGGLWKMDQASELKGGLW